MLTGRDLEKIAAKIANLGEADLIGHGIISGSSGGSDWDRFNRDPVTFILKLDDDRRDILAALVSPYRTAVT